MRIVHVISAWIMIAGMALVACGGMHVRRDPDGTWVGVNAIHAAGGGILLAGVALSVVSAFGSGRPRDRGSSELPPRDA